MRKIEFDSLYFGGGSPSLLSLKFIDSLLGFIKKRFKFKENAQIQFDCSPFTLTNEKIKLLSNHGINRVTIGVQSFDKKVLKKNNRPYLPFEQLKKIISEIKKCRIPEINIDLISGLEEQSKAIFIDDVNKAIKLKPTIIHLYPLTPTGVALFNKVDIKKTSNWIKSATKILRKVGYKKLRNDGWGLNDSARNVQESDVYRYNSSVLGLGNGSQTHIFGYLTYITISSLQGYITSIRGGLPHYFGYEMNEDREKRWYILHNLVGVDGVSREIFLKVFNKDVLDIFGSEFKKLEKKRTVKITDKEIVLTDCSLESQRDIINTFYEQKFINKIKSLLKNEKKKNSLFANN